MDKLWFPYFFLGWIFNNSIMDLGPCMDQGFLTEDLSDLTRHVMYTVGSLGAIKKLQYGKLGPISRWLLGLKVSGEKRIKIVLVGPFEF